MSGGINAEDRGAGFDLIDSKGISADADWPSPSLVTGVKIMRNHIHDNDGFGIKLDGVTNSEVKGNEVHVNTEDGIALFVATDPTPDVASTGNEIKDNVATGNGDGATSFDLSHDGGSSPNTWEDNQCVTKAGADIPAC